MNVLALVGVLSRPVEVRVLPSGDHLAAFDVTVARVKERAESVPVTWLRPPASAPGMAVGEEVVVTGRVRRRFFRAGGTLQSRTEVVADAVVLTRHRRRAQSALAAVGVQVADSARRWEAG